MKYVKRLPEQLLAYLHLLFGLMYEARSIPALCKESTMAESMNMADPLLYNEAEPTRHENYISTTLDHALSLNEL